MVLGNDNNMEQAEGDLQDEGVNGENKQEEVGAQHAAHAAKLVLSTRCIAYPVGWHGACSKTFANHNC